MYSESYCSDEREDNLALMYRGIDAAIAADLYVLVDWHILNDADPNENAESAAAFFDRIAAAYAGCPNLLFEICNEPNGSTDWSDILRYCDTVIPVIRRHIPDAVIVVGTPEYDRNLGDCLLRPVPYDNVMYVLHFYTATHHEGLLGELQSAVSAGLPVFISECGISEASGDGRLDFASAAVWFSYLKEHQISYAVWSLSDKDESSAFFRPGFDPYGPISDGDLTPAGLWIRELIRGADPGVIEGPADVVEKTALMRLRSRISDSLGDRGYTALRSWVPIAGTVCAAVPAAFLLHMLVRKAGKRKLRTYDDIVGTEKHEGDKGIRRILSGLTLILSVCSTLIYLCWRVLWSVPVGYGVLAVAGNILLLIVEVFGFVESLILFRSLLGMREHPLPSIPADAWPEVDVFIATYNEPADLLRRTVNGCVHMRYPDPSKVHIWICDDNRRPAMRALAEEMGVGYFDRPDNKGAKAGNLNHAMALTTAPYIVTFDADMIPKSDFC